MCEIESPWFEKIPMHDFEKQALQDNIEQLPYGQNKKFACTFELESWMDEMVVRIVEDFKDSQLTEEGYQRNLMSDTNI